METAEPTTWGIAPPPQPVVTSQIYADGAPGTSGSVIVRNMVSTDAEFTARLTVEAFRSKFVHAIGENKLETFIKLLSKREAQREGDHHRIFIAEYEGRKAGVCELRFHGSKDAAVEEPPYCSELGCCSTMGLMNMECLLGGHDEERGSCYIDHICVDSDFRGKGVGKVLMDRVDYEARKKGCRKMTLAVAQSNRAKNLYERQGYVVNNLEDTCCFGVCAVGIRKFYAMEKTL